MPHWASRIIKELYHHSRCDLSAGVDKMIGAKERAEKIDPLYVYI
jgi:hypothetical protein